ncbi:MAG: holo-ACP synthase [Lachnospirales bacterium]
MIKGIGTDIIEIERIKEALKKEGFLERIYTRAEKRLYNENNPQSMAGNFAVKEAVAKALGCGFKGCSPLEIEVLRRRSGAPYINLYGNTKKIFDEIGGKNIFVSISHSKENAVAYVIIEG